MSGTSTPAGGPAAAGARPRLLAAGIVGAILIGIVAIAAAVGWVQSSQPVGAHLTPGPSSSSIAAGPTGSPTVTPTLAPGPTPEPTPALVPDPLTGLPVTESAAERHPIAVMIDDHVDARPQSGFNSAAIVWQAPAEGGIPRYMMIFQDQVPATVGPIRSARQYFIEWASEWHAMYVHAGGSPQALATLAASGHGTLVWNADALRWEGRYMWRIHTRFAPHNLYTDGTHLEGLGALLGATNKPLTPVWHFAPDLVDVLRPVGGTIVVTYPYESITYRYDAKTNTYRRFLNGSKKAQVDAVGGAFVAPKNVIIIKMHFGPLNDGHPNKHRLEAADIGHGEAWIATNGHTIHGTWRKASITAPTLLFGPDGKPVTLTAGQTFVQVLPLTYGLQIHDGAARPYSMGRPSGAFLE